MPIEVTIPLVVSAFITFQVDRTSEVTPELIAEKVAEAQRMRDRAGDDEAGVYYVITGHGEPGFDGEDEPEQVDAECADGIHSWAYDLGRLPPDTRCTRCGELYGNPD